MPPSAPSRRPLFAAHEPEPLDAPIWTPLNVALLVMCAAALAVVLMVALIGTGAATGEPLPSVIRPLD